MDKYQETFITWNKIAGLYQDKFMGMDLYNRSYDIFCDSIETSNAEILEVGCGPGNITQYLLSKRPDFKILGIDIAPRMIELAKANNPSARFKVMDGRRIDDLKDRYHGIICGFFLPFLSEADTEKFIADSHELLQKNGLLYFSFVEGDPNNSGFKTGADKSRVYFYFHSLDKIKLQLTNNNFTDINVLHVNYKKSASESDVHTIVTAQKKEVQEKVSLNRKEVG